MIAESDGQKREIRAPGPLQFDVLKGHTLKKVKTNLRYTVIMIMKLYLAFYALSNKLQYGNQKRPNFKSDSTQQRCKIILGAFYFVSCDFETPMI